MSAAAVLAIVVAVGEAQSPASTALQAAAAESLGSATSVRLVELKDPTDRNAIRVAQELGARAVVVVVWKEPPHLHAVLRLHTVRGSLWTVRTVAFAPGDTLAERGRTLGLAVAAMIPEKSTQATSGALPVRPPTPPPPPPPVPAPVPVPVPVPVAVAVPSPAPPSEPPPPPATSPPPSRSPLPGEASPPPPATAASSRATPPVIRTPAPRRRAIGAAVAGAIGLGGGPATGVGGQVEAVWFSMASLAVRGGFGTRRGALSSLAGHDLVSTLGLGLEWWPLGAQAGASWAVGIRVDLLVLDHRVTAAPAGGSPEVKHAILPGSDVVGQFRVALTPSLFLLAGAGLESAFGTIELRQGNDRVVVATIPALRLVAGCGFRLGF